MPRPFNRSRLGLSLGRLVWRSSCVFHQLSLRADHCCFSAARDRDMECSTVDGSWRPTPQRKLISAWDNVDDGSCCLTDNYHSGNAFRANICNFRELSFDTERKYTARNHLKGSNCTSVSRALARLRKEMRSSATLYANVLLFTPSWNFSTVTLVFLSGKIVVKI